MSNFNRREFLEVTAASYLLGAMKVEGAPESQPRISEGEKSVRVEGNEYTWEWSKDTDQFRLLDQWGLVIADGALQPAVLVQPHKQSGTTHCMAGKPTGWKVHSNQISIHYEGVNGSAQLTMTWRFDHDGFWLDPVLYETSAAEDVVSFHYFAQGKGDRALPTLNTDYIVAPGIATSSEMSPIVPTGFAGAFLKQKCWLGRGWAVDPKVLQTQQWGLPVHYFCAFHRSPYSYQMKPPVKLPEPAPEKLLDSYLNALCCGLAELPNGDLMMETSDNCCSPILNYRGDLWGHLHGPGRLSLGARMYWTVGPNYYEAIRRYYLGLAKAGVVRKKTNSAHKNAVALAPSFCTFGEQLARNRVNDLDESVLNAIYEGMQRSGTKAKLFVIDGGWESKWGSLRHSEKRLPNFMDFLERLRAQGMYVGLWSAFMRCEDPAGVGLATANMLHTHEGKPYVLDQHSPSPFYIMDCTQPKVQAVMRRRAKDFMQRYRPDFLKFDFGYEIPSLNVVAPQDMAWAGERFMMKALEVTIGAMREVNPDLVVLYYSLSPLFLDYFDLHSPDDLGRCTGDFDLEANRRFFFSSLLGEIGMPTWGSSGYDWPSAPSIWFDTAAIGALGSLLSYWGPEAKALGKPEIVAKYNGLAHAARPANTFSMTLIDEAYHGPERGPHAASWARTENGEVVLVALRERRFDGRKATKKFRTLVSTSAAVVVASKTPQGIARTAKLAVVPYGDGEVTVRRESTAPASATVTEHYFGGGEKTSHVSIHNGLLAVPLRERAENASIVEWIEVDISEA